MSEESLSKPHRQPRFKITSKRFPARHKSETSDSPDQGPISGADNNICSNEKESKVQQYAQNSGVKTGHQKRFRSESRPRLIEHQDYTYRGHAHSNGVETGELKAERFAHRRSKSSLDGFYSYNNADRVQQGLGLSKGFILDTIIRHGLDKTIKGEKNANNFDRALLKIARGGDTIYDIPNLVNNDEFPFETAELVPREDTLVERHPLSIVGEPSPTVLLPSNEDAPPKPTRSRTMSEPPKNRMVDMDAEMSEHLKPDKIFECNFGDDLSVDAIDMNVPKVRKRSKGKNKRKKGSTHSFLSSPKSMSGSKLLDCQDGFHSPGHSPPSSYRIHGKANRLEDLVARKRSDENVGRGSKGKKSFRHWQPGGRTLEDAPDAVYMSESKQRAICKSSPHADSADEKRKGDQQLKGNVFCEKAMKDSPNTKVELSMSTAKKSPSNSMKGKRRKKASPRNECSPCVPSFRFRRRRPSLNRQNFFGNLAQAVGKELNSIAYRNSLFHSFPGMVGLYRPDIGMDSLFKNASSVEPSETEDGFEGYRGKGGKGRRGKDDDDTLRQVSSEERFESEREQWKEGGKKSVTPKRDSSKGQGKKAASAMKAEERTPKEALSLLEKDLSTVKQEVRSRNTSKGESKESLKSGQEIDNKRSQFSPRSYRSSKSSVSSKEESPTNMGAEKSIPVIVSRRSLETYGKQRTTPDGNIINDQKLESRRNSSSLKPPTKSSIASPAAQERKSSIRKMTIEMLGTEKIIDTSSKNMPREMANNFEMEPELIQSLEQYDADSKFEEDHLESPIVDPRILTQGSRSYSGYRKQTIVLESNEKGDSTLNRQDSRNNPKTSREGSKEEHVLERLESIHRDDAQTFEPEEETIFRNSEMELRNTARFSEARVKKMTSSIRSTMTKKMSDEEVVINDNEQQAAMSLLKESPWSSKTGRFSHSLVKTPIDGSQTFSGAPDERSFIHSAAKLEEALSRMSEYGGLENLKNVRQRSFSQSDRFERSSKDHLSEDQGYEFKRENIITSVKDSYTKLKNPYLNAAKFECDDWRSSGIGKTPLRESAYFTGPSQHNSEKSFFNHENNLSPKVTYAGGENAKSPIEELYMTSPSSASSPETVPKATKKSSLKETRKPTNEDCVEKKNYPNGEDIKEECQDKLKDVEQHTIVITSSRNSIISCDTSYIVHIKRPTTDTIEEVPVECKKMTKSIVMDCENSQKEQTEEPHETTNEDPRRNTASGSGVNSQADSIKQSEQKLGSSKQSRISSIQGITDNNTVSPQEIDYEMTSRKSSIVSKTLSQPVKQSEQRFSDQAIALKHGIYEDGCEGIHEIESEVAGRWASTESKAQLRKSLTASLEQRKSSARQSMEEADNKLSAEGSYILGARQCSMDSQEAREVEISQEDELELRRIESSMARNRSISGQNVVTSRLPSQADNNTEEQEKSQQGSIQEINKMSRKASMARSVSKDSKLSRHSSQEVGGRVSSTHERKSRHYSTDQSRIKSRKSSVSEKTSSRLDNVPLEARRRSIKSSQDRQRHLDDHDESSVASHDTSTWKQSKSKESRIHVMYDSGSEKTYTHTLDDPPSIATYDSDKQDTVHSAIDSDTSVNMTNDKTTENESTMSGYSRGSKRMSQAKSKSSEKDYRKSCSKEKCRFYDESYLQREIRRPQPGDNSDDYCSSSDEGTFKSESRVKHDNVAAGDTCPHGQVKKIRGRITFRSSDDKRSPSSKRSTTIDIQNGNFKMTTSPKMVRPNYDTGDSTDVSDHNEAIQRFGMGGAVSHKRSNSISAMNDSMKRYMQDSEYIRERQLRLLYQQNLTQSCDTGSYASLTGGHKSPVPAPRISRKGNTYQCPADFTDSYDDEFSGRVVQKRTYRSRSNTARYEYAVEQYRGKLIDSFTQVITPEQPSGIHPSTGSGREHRTNYITQHLRSPNILDEKPRDFMHSESVVENVIIDTVSCVKLLPAPSGKTSSVNFNRSMCSPRTPKTNPYLHVKNEFIPCDYQVSEEERRKPQCQPMPGKVYTNTDKSPAISVNFDADNENSVKSLQYSLGKNQENARFIPENDHAEFSDSSPDIPTLLAVAKNKNCSSNTERDQNASSGGGDFLYSDFAYHCGVIDTLRLLDIDNVSSTGSTKWSLTEVVDEMSELTQKKKEKENLDPAFPAMYYENQDDEAIEIVRQNSIRALLFAASMSNSWSPFHFFPNSTTKETAKWIQELKDRPAEIDSLDSVQKYLKYADIVKEADKKSDEIFNNTSILDWEVKNWSENFKAPSIFARKSKEKSEHFEENIHEAAIKKNTATKSTTVSKWPLENLVTETAADNGKKTIVDAGANTDFIKHDKTFSVNIQEECMKHAAIQTVSSRTCVEKCDKSENTEPQYFVKDAKMETVSLKQHGGNSKHRNTELRHNYSAPDCKELHSSSRRSHKRNRENGSNGTARCDKGIEEIVKFLSAYTKSGHHEHNVRHSGDRAHITSKERSLSLDSVQAVKKSSSPLSKATRKRSCEGEKKLPAHDNGEIEQNYIKTNALKKSSSCKHSILVQIPQGDDIAVDEKNYAKKCTNNESWYEDYDPCKISGTSEKSTGKKHFCEKYKHVCGCQRCQRRRQDLQNYINARKKGRGKHDVSTINKTENNSKRNQNREPSLMDNLTIFVVASQSSLASDDSEDVAECHQKLIKRALKKASSVCSDCLNNVHIYAVADSEMQSQLPKSSTVEDLGQFTTSLNDKTLALKKETTSASNNVDGCDLEVPVNGKKLKKIEKQMKETRVKIPATSSPHKLKDKNLSVVRGNTCNSSKGTDSADSVTSQDDKVRHNEEVHFAKKARPVHVSSNEEKLHDCQKDFFSITEATSDCTTSSKFKSTYDGTDPQTSNGVFSFSCDRETSTKSSSKQDTITHSSRRSDFEEYKSRNSSEAVVTTPEKSCNRSSPLRFFQSIIDGQVKVLLDKAIQNWTTPIIGKAGHYRSKSSSVDLEKNTAVDDASSLNKTRKHYKCTSMYTEKGNDMKLEFAKDYGIPDKSHSPSEKKDEVKAGCKAEENSTTLCRDPNVNIATPLTEMSGIHKYEAHKEDTILLCEVKNRNVHSGKKVTPTKSEKCLLDAELLKSKSTSACKIYSAIDLCTGIHLSARDTDILPETKNHNATTISAEKDDADSENVKHSGKRHRSKKSSSHKLKRKRRSEDQSESNKINRRASKSLGRSQEKSSPDCLMSSPTGTMRSPVNRVSRKSENRAKKKKSGNYAVEVTNESPKIKSFSECGLWRIASKLSGDNKNELITIEKSCSSTDDLRQKIMKSSKKYGNEVMDQRIKEELLARQQMEDMDADSLAGCEAIESCFLTPITEESQVSHDNAENNFSTFVGQCKEKLRDIISKSKSSVSNSRSQTSNKSVCVCKNEESLSHELSKHNSRKCTKPIATSIQPSTSVLQDPDEMLSSSFKSLNKREVPSGLLMAKGPYKSAFLRNEMSYYTTDLDDFDSVLKENQLISQYTLKKCYDRSREWMHGDVNYSKNKYSDHLDNFRHFTSTMTSYPSTMSYRFSLTESHYRSTYLKNSRRNYDDMASQLYNHRHSVFAPGASDYNIERPQWMMNDNGGRAYTKFIKRNKNESANNGNDSTSSESSGVEDDFTTVDGASQRTYCSNEKLEKDLKCHTDIKQKARKNSCDRLYCQFHDTNSSTFEVFRSNVPANLVSTLASRNINGSGNMFGRSMEDIRGSNHINIGDHLGDSDDDYTSASEDMLNYNSVNMRNKFNPLEMDDTCNHPDAIGYYTSKGQSSQVDMFNGAPKEDLLVNMFSMDDSHPTLISSYKQKMDMAEKKQACVDVNNGHGQSTYKDGFTGSRSCFGQGDTSSKKGFTQWYVDDPDKSLVVQRRLSTANEAGKYVDASDELFEGDGELEDEDDNEQGEYEDPGEEDDEDDDDVGDEEDEEDDNEDVESDESNADMGSPHAVDDGECRRKSGSQEVDDQRPSKKESTNASDSLHRRAAQNKSYNQNKYKCFDSKTGKINMRNNHHGHRYSYSSRNKHGSCCQKFSFDQIKVPTIEKERVRFACDENGDWAEIGRGSYGCVYLGLLDGIIEVAIKDFYESSSWDLVIHEARMLMFLQDTGITPKFYGLRRRFDVSKQPSEYCIIMEYFGDGRTLFNVMSDKIALTKDAWLDIVGQLVAGLRLIHGKNILINDLKADNILIDLTGGRKIIRYIDVGMATYKQGLTFQLPQDQMNRYNFLAPEVREGARTTTRSDIYSLGYMLEQVCRMADSALGGLKKLVTKCTDKNPTRRPDIDEIVSQVHRFIASKACAPSAPSIPQEQFLLTNSV